ncbi:hypothetical protein GF420_11725 [candidate division GN15 bacterium]|nr:hypothetical protein [candidate division GN15 bacterium]
MTDRLYYTDPSLLVFEATVTAVGRDDTGPWVALDRSAFYPTSGGQMADRGRIDDIAVVDVVETEAGDVRHVLASAIEETGKKVVGRIDEERRWRHRQQHTAQHLISAVAGQHFGWETVSVHLGEEYGAIEVPSTEVTAEQLTVIEREVNRIVRANEPVTIRIVPPDEIDQVPFRKTPDRSGPLRVIRIGDLDWSACGGTHCLSTAEVGLVKIIGSEKQRGRILITFLAGQQALADYQRRFAVTESLARELTCHFEDLPDKFDKLQREQKDQKKQLSSLQKQLLPIRAAELATRAESVDSVQVVVEAVADIGPGAAASLVGQAAEKIGGVAMLLVGDRLVIGVHPDTGLHAGNLARSLCDTLGLRGGGSPTAAQIGGAERDKLAEYRAALAGAIAGG